MPQTALIIDDNTLNIEVITMLLQREGLSVQSILSASQIRQALDGLLPPAVVFLDLEFPNASGFDLLNIIKGHAVTQGVPVVAYSVHTSEVDRARSSGFDGFLGKPLNMQRFSEQLKAILSGQKIWEV